MGWRAFVKAERGAFLLDVDLQGNEAPVALVGPNGSGKTTLLRVISGASRPTWGEIEIGGTAVFSTRHGIDLPSEDRRVGYVPQGYGLFPHLRVIDNVAFGLSTGKRKQPSAVRRRVARDMLERLECAGLADRWPQWLSGGEQQRVALARAMVVEPAMLLLDEPLSALDVGVRRRVRSFLAERLLSLGCPTLVVTHDVRDVIALGAHICVLDRGHIVQQGSLEALGAAPVNDFVAEFVGTI